VARLPETLAAWARRWDVALDGPLEPLTHNYIVGALLRNRLPEPLVGPEARRALARRVDQLSENLGFDRARVRDWAVAQPVLSAWWTVEEHGHGWERAIACAELLASIEV